MNSLRVALDRGGLINDQGGVSTHLSPVVCFPRCCGAGSAEQTERPVEKVSALGMVRRDTALLLRDFRQGASNWIQSLLDPNKTATPAITGQAAEGPAADPGTLLLYYCSITLLEY